MFSGEARHGDDERRAGVLQPAQHAGGGHHDEHRGDAGPADPQVRRRPASVACAGGTEGRGHRAGASRVSAAPVTHAEQQGQPHAVHAQPQGPEQVARAGPAGHRCGGPVGEEDEDAGAVARAAEAMPRPASCTVPSRPTMAESASRKSGSATSARKAGTASRSTSREVASGCRAGDARGIHESSNFLPSTGCAGHPCRW